MEFQEYPKAMYHDDGRHVSAVSAEHEAALGGDGYRREPSPAHIAANASRPSIVPRVDLSGWDQMIEALILRMREEFFASPDEDATAPARRARGRPRKTHAKNVTQARAGSRSASTADEGEE